jgi:hypothetical protein
MVRNTYVCYERVYWVCDNVTMESVVVHFITHTLNTNAPTNDRLVIGDKLVSAAITKVSAPLDYELVRVASYE